MLTDPKLRSQVDQLWGKLWKGGLTNPLDTIGSPTPPGTTVTLRTAYTPSGGPRGRPAASWSSLSPSAVLWLQRTCPARFRILIAALWS
ncbi:MAG: hypothetical protein KJ077_24895 [Anaerolineae bacterium]|nr:hypothetical protein [Anaerolineae bacterium]